MLTIGRAIFETSGSINLVYRGLYTVTPPPPPPILVDPLAIGISSVVVFKIYLPQL